MPIFLGVTVDTLRGTFHVPQDKLDDLVKSMEELLVLRRPKVRRLASAVGKLVTAYRSLGKNLVGLMTRDSYRVISSVGYNWDYYVNMTGDSKRELSWWIENIRQLNIWGRDMQPSPSPTYVDHFLAGTLLVSASTSCRPALRRPGKGVRLRSTTPTTRLW